jgi:hypothetical protein
MSVFPHISPILEYTLLEIPNLICRLYKNTLLLMAVAHLLIFEILLDSNPGGQSSFMLVGKFMFFLFLSATDFLINFVNIFFERSSYFPVLALKKTTFVQNFNVANL